MVRARQAVPGGTIMVADIRPQGEEEPPAEEAGSPGEGGGEEEATFVEHKEEEPWRS